MRKKIWIAPVLFLQPSYTRIYVKSLFPLYPLYESFGKLVAHFAPLWPDGEAQKVITLGILLFGRAPQVYYFGLHRMKCELAMAESVADLSQNKLGLLLRFAMHHHIICIALKWLFWVVCLSIHLSKHICMKILASSGLITPPCGVPVTLSMRSPSSCALPAFNHLRIYNRTQRSLQKWLTALISMS